MLKTRRYGDRGPLVLVLHGGPGAPGYMAPVARELAQGDPSFRVLEPFQRPSGDEPLTVARHIEDLHELLSHHSSEGPVALVGSSWGAMLALAYAAEYPERAGPLVLIGSGTFDVDSRAEMKRLIAEATDEAIATELARIERDLSDPDERLAAKADAITPIYAYDPITTDLETDHIDARSNRETWDDMVRLQEAGIYPARFERVTSPVLMLHGTFDPHPGRMIRESLLPVIPHLEYTEWDECGHYPWIERSRRDAFFQRLRGWLGSRGAQ